MKPIKLLRQNKENTKILLRTEKGFEIKGSLKEKTLEDVVKRFKYINILFPHSKLKLLR